MTDSARPPHQAGEFSAGYGFDKRVIVPEAAIRRFSEKLGKASFAHADVQTSLASAQSGDVVFLDPPYRPSIAGEKSRKQYTAEEFSIADYQAMVSGAELAASRGATVFVHDHHTSETLELHPNATAVLPVKVARRFSKDRTAANEVIFIYRPAVDKASQRLTPRRNSANDVNFNLVEVQKKVVGSDCSSIVGRTPSAKTKNRTGLHSVASNHKTI